MSERTLIYLYGVVGADAPAPPPELRGLEGEPLALVPSGPVAGVVSEVPEALYGSAALEPRLAELSWVGERAVVHEGVLTWFSDRGAVLPMQPFSLHESAPKLSERLVAAADVLAEQLARLAGRRQWGVRLWLDESVLRPRLHELSETLAALRAEMESAAPGRRFLLAKKIDAVAAEELRAAVARQVRVVFERLRAHAAQARALPIPSAATGEARALVLNAVFLVEEERFAAFQQQVTEVAHAHRALGFELEFTGPWPAYHFVELDAL